MNPDAMPSHSSDPDSELNQSWSERDWGWRQFVNRLRTTEKRDILIQTLLDHLQQTLQVDRVVIYYFYRPWQGQVTFESLSDPQLSIYGSTGADECFNDEYAQFYLNGRIQAIADIETASIHPCHQEFLRSLEIYANLVVPIIINHQLWGLLIAHDCHHSRIWHSSDIETMKAAAHTVSSNLKSEDE
jgi:GAF domain-containing protein